MRRLDGRERGIAGTVLDPDGAPVPHLLLVGFMPDAEGRFGPLRMPVGRGILRREGGFLQPPGPVLAEVDLEPGETRELELP